MLGVPSLDGSRKPQRRTVGDQMAAGTKSLRDGERRAAGGSSIQRSETTRGMCTCSIRLSCVARALHRPGDCVIRDPIAKKLSKAKELSTAGWNCTRGDPGVS
jgi:hypothetical protein